MAMNMPMHIARKPVHTSTGFELASATSGIVWPSREPRYRSDWRTVSVTALAIENKRASSRRSEGEDEPLLPQWHGPIRADSQRMKRSSQAPALHVRAN